MLTWQSLPQMCDNARAILAVFCVEVHSGPHETEKVMSYIARIACLKVYIARMALLKVMGTLVWILPLGVMLL